MRLARNHVWMAAAAVVAGIAAIAWSCRPLGPAPRLGWETGKQYVYGLALTHRQETRLEALVADRPMTERVTVDGRLRVRALGRRGDAFVLGVSLAGVDRLELEALGQTVPPPADLEQHEALAEVLPTGEVQAISFAPETPAHVASLLKLLVGELQLRLDGADARTWQLQEASALGQVAARYQRSRSFGDRVEIDRRRSGYTSLVTFTAVGGAIAAQTLESAHTARLASGGPLERLSGHERLSASRPGASLSVDSEISAELREVSGFGRVDVAGLLARARRHRLADAILPEGAAKAALVQQSEGLRFEDVVAGIHRVEAGEKGQEHNRWLWRTMGLLRADPALCRKLVPVFGGTGLTERGRLLVLEVLAATGHGEAQAVMRELLDRHAHPSADLEYVRRVQRLSLLDRPDEATARFVSEAHHDATGDVRRAAAYTLGAMVAQLESEPTLRRELNAELVDALARASGAEEQSHYLQAIGNAGQAENFPLVERFAQKKESTLRDAAARALRKTADPKSQDLLVTLAGDRSQRVQHAAVLTLQRQGTDDARLTAIGQKILKDEIAPDTYALVLVSVRRIADPALRRTVAQHMLAHAPSDDDLKGRIAALLAPS